jgi:hypothetical protein
MYNMTAVVSALDNFTPSQLGENLHKEYTWSKSIQERILQLSYQLTRTQEEETLDKLSMEYKKLLKEVFYSNKESEELTNFKGYLIALIPYTRDIIAGKGEYNLNYNLISTLALVVDENRVQETTYHMEQLLFNAIRTNVQLEGFHHPYGSWKDMKYLLNHLWYVFGQEKLIKMPLFNFILELYCDQLRVDIDSETPSLCARWVPREKSRKFGWITKYIASTYYESSFRRYETESEVTGPSSLSIRKCLTHFRKLVAGINNRLKTPQINFCNGDWKNINFDKDVTSITLAKMRKAFQYVDEDSNVKDEQNEDRMKCRENYLNYLQECSKGEKTIKNARVGIIDMIKQATKVGKNKYVRSINQEENKLLETSLNLQWEEAGKLISNMDKYVAMVDTSGSMEGDPINAAVGLGIRIAENSSLGKRVLTFSSHPQWINLEDKEGLVEMATCIESNSSWGMNTNLASAAKLILDACIVKNLTPEEVEGIVLVILSDMQIDKADSNANSITDLLTTMFEEGGKRTSHKKPYKRPKILFWNLRSTGGFPALSFTENVSMVSGFSPMLLNNFCIEGISSLDKFTPWSILTEQLKNERFTWAWNAVKNTI